VRGRIVREWTPDCEWEWEWEVEVVVREWEGFERRPFDLDLDLDDLEDAFEDDLCGLFACERTGRCEWGMTRERD
jgi:hypothetical protein